MKCFGTDKNGLPCGKEGTEIDWETPAIFLQPDGQGGRVRPVHCAVHHYQLLERREKNARSWLKMMVRD